MLALVNSFAGQDARDVFESPAGSVHVFAVCALLFIQLLGRHMYEASSQDHWPAFQGANEAAVEQIETSKASMSRRPSASKAGALQVHTFECLSLLADTAAAWLTMWPGKASKCTCMHSACMQTTARAEAASFLHPMADVRIGAGQGPTKAHRLHLKHVQKQFRAWEKRLAALLAKHVAPFLELLAQLRSTLNIAAGLLQCFSLLLETADGRPFAAAHIGDVRNCLRIISSGCTQLVFLLRAHMASVHKPEHQLMRMRRLMDP